MSFPYLGETRELNEITRREAGGSFARLTDGFTHYQMGGESNGPPVVLVHGFSVPCFIFDRTFEFLTNSGFRVLRYDLFGRGFSDRPVAHYDIHLYTRQLVDLLDVLAIGQVHLVGLSMGGPITASFIRRYPERVQKHVLIDPAGTQPIHLAMLGWLKLPLVGELALGLFGSAAMVRNIASDLFDPGLVDQFRARYAVQMQYRGFKRAILSTLRNDMLGSFYDTYEQISRFRKPTLLFWGTKDPVVPFENSSLLLRALPHAEFHAIENCGHIPHFERPNEVEPILLGFLKKG